MITDENFKNFEKIIESKIDSILHCEKYAFSLKIIYFHIMMKIYPNF